MRSKTKAVIMFTLIAVDVALFLFGRFELFHIGIGAIILIWLLDGLTRPQETKECQKQ